MANPCPVAYVLGLRTLDSAGTVKSACKPYASYPGSTYWGGITQLGPPYYEPVSLPRETLAFGQRDVVIGYRGKVPVEFLSTSTGILCQGGDAKWDGTHWTADFPDPAAFSGLSTFLANVCTAGYYAQITLNGDAQTPTFYRCVIEEFSQETLDPERFVGMRMRYLFAKADLQTSNMNSLSISTW